MSRATNRGRGMSVEPLDRRILREIRARLKESREAVDEYERLQAMLRALDGGVDEPRPATRRPRRAAPSTTHRAPRGANREKALRVIGDRPGVTVAELASATGIAKNVVYSLTRALTRQGHIERLELPGDTIGFRVADPTKNSHGAGAGDDGATADAAATRNRGRGSRKAARHTDEDDSPADPAADEAGPSTRAASA